MIFPLIRNALYIMWNAIMTIRFFYNIYLRIFARLYNKKYCNEYRNFTFSTLRELLSYLLQSTKLINGNYRDLLRIQNALFTVNILMKSSSVYFRYYNNILNMMIKIIIMIISSVIIY